MARLSSCLPLCPVLDGYGLMDGLPPHIRSNLFRIPTQNRVRPGGTSSGRQTIVAGEDLLGPYRGRNLVGGTIWRSPNAKYTKAGRLMLRVPNGGARTNRDVLAGSLASVVCSEHCCCLEVLQSLSSPHFCRLL